MILSHECKRKLSHQGIQFLQLFYNAEELRTMRIRFGNKAKVAIRVDLENLGSIWVYDQYSGEYLIIPCTEPDYAEGLTLRQHKAELKQRMDNKSKLVDSDNVLELKEAVRQKIQQANQTKSLRQRTRAKRLDTPPLTAPYDTNNNKLSNNQFIEPDFLLDDLDIPDFEIIKYGENKE